MNLDSLYELEDVTVSLQIAPLNYLHINAQKPHSYQNIVTMSLESVNLTKCQEV